MASNNDTEMTDQADPPALQPGSSIFGGPVPPPQPQPAAAQGQSQAQAQPVIHGQPPAQLQIHPQVFQFAPGPRPTIPLPHQWPVPFPPGAGAPMIAPPAAPAAHVVPAGIIRLNVGGTYMTTHATTLQGAKFFEPLLSGRHTWARDATGSYFIDTDPTVFAHLLNWLRHTDVYPLFWSRTAGFDYPLYTRLEALARYFQADALATWIAEKRYRAAITVHVRLTSSLYTDNQRLQETDTETADCDVQKEIKVYTRQEYTCPRVIPEHLADLRRCGRSCEQARLQGGIDAVVVQTVREVITTTKEVVLSRGECMHGV